MLTIVSTLAPLHVDAGRDIGSYSSDANLAVTGFIVGAL
jgi:hypothetical protein